MAGSPYQKWTRKLTENLSDHFNLAGWEIYMKWSDTTEERDGEETHATISVNSQYQWAIVTFFPPAKSDFDSGNYERLAQSVTHEMVHIFLDPFQNWMHDHLSITTSPLFTSTVEQQTQKLTMVILKTLPSSVIPPPPHGKHNRTSKNGKSRPVVS